MEKFVIQFKPIEIIIIGHHTHFRRNDDLLLSRGPAIKKTPNACAIVRSRVCAVQSWGMTLNTSIAKEKMCCEPEAREHATLHRQSYWVVTFATIQSSRTNQRRLSESCYSTEIYSTFQTNFLF